MHRVAAELAPRGVLRAAINLANKLLVTGKAANGDPVGVAPGMAAALAKRVGVPLRLIPYATPKDVVDAAASGEWDVALIGADPLREELIAFSASYAQIEATYLVPAGSRLARIGDADAAGIRIAAPQGSAYGLFLKRTLKRAELLGATSGSRSVSFEESAVALVAEGRADALAGLRPFLPKLRAQLPGSTILPGHFATVEQAVGVLRVSGDAAAAYCAAFVEEAKAQGLVAALIAEHGVQGLSVAPKAAAPGL